MQVKAVATHSATRFASVYLVAESCLRTQEALQLMVIDSAWPEVSKKTTRGKEFEEAVARPSYWEELSAVAKLLRPFSDAIHQLESDRPLLSQAVPTWLAVAQHVVQWLSANVGSTLIFNVMHAFVFR